MDFTNSKNNGTAQYPVHAEETSGLLKRVEPPLTPEKLISRYLKGIPLKFPNGDSFSDEDLKDKINLAVNEAELLIGAPINPECFKDKLAFDMNLYRSFIYLKSEHGPIVSLQHLRIVAANGQSLYEIPPEWIEAANFHKKLINVIPLLGAYGISSVSAASFYGPFYALISSWSWVPAYWEIKYVAGLSNKEGQVPIPVNELVGVLATISILSLIAPSNIYSSQSLSQDGISQSSSGAGPRLYELRISELEIKKDELIKKLKGVFSSKFFISNI